MPLLASGSLLRENKNVQQQNVTLSESWTTGLGFQVQYSPLYTNWALATLEIFMHHLILGLGWFS